MTRAVPDAICRKMELTLPKGDGLFDRRLL
jgi:hypothetical protein